MHSVVAVAVYSTSSSNIEAIVVAIVVVVLAMVVAQAALVSPAVEKHKM